MIESYNFELLPGNSLNAAKSLIKCNNLKFDPRTTMRTAMPMVMQNFEIQSYNHERNAMSMRHAKFEG